MHFHPHKNGHTEQSTSVYEGCRGQDEEKNDAKKPRERSQLAFRRKNSVRVQLDLVLNVFFIELILIQIYLFEEVY